MARTRIKGSDIEELTISADKLADDAVTAASIADGSITNAKIADNTISDAKLIGLDASKLTGIIPFNLLSNGELGFLIQPNWPDNVTQTITLIKPAQGIGRVVVKVYEEIDVSGTIIHRDVTNDYIIDIISINQIDVTSPSSGGPRNAKVFVTS